MLCHFRQEWGTCVSCKTTSITPILKKHYERRGWCSGKRIQPASRLARFNTRGHSMPDIFIIKINGHRLTLLNIIGAIHHGHWNASYIKSTRMSHRPLHYNKTVVLCVYMMTTCTSASADIEIKKKKTLRSLPSLTIQRRRHLEI